MKIHIIILSTFVFTFQFLPAQDSPRAIRLDQEGYYPKAPKIAILAGNFITTASDTNNRALFYVIDERNRDTVFRGKLSAIRFSKNSSIQTRSADFSGLKIAGIYRISTDGVYSYPFDIREKVHREAAVASLKAFYYQRASMPLEPLYAGKWSRSAGHFDTAVLIHPSAVSSNRKAGDIISTPGGWYDAGDYNKYVVNSGISTATLLSAYEDFKTYFDTLHTNIPKLNKPIPDLLNEVLYNLRWMLSMQDPSDGGVYNKCTNTSFDPMVMPNEALQPRYVVQKGTAATLDLAAVAAQAARIFSEYKLALPGFSDSCLLAAEKAWTWALAHPNMSYDQNAMNLLYSPKIITGGYGDNKFTDEWFWSACELYISTAKTKYLDTITAHVNDRTGLPSWSETGMLGYYSLLKNKTKHAMPFMDTVRSRLVILANNYIQSAQQNAFLTVMGGRRNDFVWGSNANAANQGILLIQVYRFTGMQKYLDAALGNLEYICGRNATGYCFITGIGSFSTMHPHHRPSVSDGIDKPIPGLLAGGPNPGEQDHCHYDFHEPETAYVDSDCAYASNEIAINWNAPLVYLANAMEALQGNFIIRK
jgi:endoglucanase